MTFNQLMTVLLSRWRVIVWTTAAFALLGLALALILPKQYAATASVFVDGRSADAFTPNNSFERSPNQNEVLVTTQIGVFESERVARRVAQQLKLAESGRYYDKWLSEADGQGDATTYVANLLLKKFDAKASTRASSVLELKFTGPDAKEATDIVNAFAQAGMEANLAIKVEPARQFVSWFDERMKTLRTEAEQAQTRLNDYVNAKNLVSGGQGQVDVEYARLQQLAAQLVQIQADRANSTSRQTQARAQADRSPEVLADPAVSSLRNALLTAEANVAQLSIQYSDSYPAMVTAREQVVMLKRQLSAEMQRVTQSLSVSDNVNVQREAAAAAAVAAQRTRVNALTGGSNQLSVLQQDVDNAQRALNAAATRLSQITLESQVQQTNVVLMSEATIPARAAAPVPWLYTVSAAALGLVIGFLLALLKEARSPRVRNLEDLAVVLGLPVFVVLPPANATKHRLPGFGNAAAASN